MPASKILAACLAGGGLWAVALGYLTLGLFMAAIGSAWLWEDEEPG